ncbi:MAG: superfamily protein [Edaphobacter sp.]|nr:superfamily protein [Edaphobacter sp.]
MPPLPVPAPPAIQPPYGVLTPTQRAETAQEIRVKAAAFQRAQPLPAHLSNGDEDLYEQKYGSYSKGLPHDNLGVVEPTAYRSFMKAIASGLPQDFQGITLGGTVKLVNPQGGLAFDLEGADSHALSIPPSPTVGSAERAAEMVELYWMAICRDVPFSDYATNPDTLAAIADLNTLSAFKGPRDSAVVDAAGNPQVTPQTLFRGDTPGELVGPYISQFFLQPAGFGDLAVLDPTGVTVQQYIAYQPGLDYMTTIAEWLAVQNGQATVMPVPPNGQFGPNKMIGPRFLFDGRAGSAFVHAPRSPSPSPCWLDH